MKQLICFVIFTIQFYSSSAQQEIKPQKVEFHTTYLQQTARVYLITEVYLNLPEGDSIRKTEPALLGLQFLFSGIDPLLLEDEKHERYVTFEGNKLIFMFSSTDKQFATQLSKQIQEQGLMLKEDIILKTEQNQQYLLKAEALLHFSRGKLNMAAGQEKFLYANYFRFGPTQTEDQLGAAVQFGILKVYAWKWLHGLSYHAEGYLGLTSESSLYYLKAFPLVFSYEKQGHYSAHFGMEADQRWENVRLSNHLQGRWTLPFQPADLRQNFHRFRLFPELTAGASFYFPLKTGLPEGERLNDAVGINMQFYAVLNYYFPVLEKLSLHLKAKAFYDTNPVLAEETHLFYDMQVGAAYSLSARTRLYMQFIKGYNEVSLRAKEGVLVGLAVEFF